VLAGLATEMLRDDVVAAFLTEYEAETRRLAAETVNVRPEREVELANLDRQIALAKAAILKGVDAAMFVEDMKAWNERRKVLLVEQDAAQTASTESQLLHPDLGRLYREKVGQLTAAFQDDALKAQAFERLRALIEAVVLTPEDGDLAIDLRGELASILSLCAGAETQKVSAVVTDEVLQIKMVAGTGFEPVTFRL
jgi:site-specific DNA recombinase